MVDVVAGAIKVTALYVGPDLGKDWVPTWRAIAEPSTGIQIGRPTTPRHGMEQLVRLPARSPSDAAITEAALDGVRRVRAIGAIYRDEDGEVHPKEYECCPYDGSVLDLILGVLPVEQLEHEGYENLDVAKREARARAAPLTVAA
jgi:hypothetical protein